MKKKKIESDLLEIMGYCRNNLHSIIHTTEVIVVDDGSQDMTAERVLNFKKKYPELSLKLISYSNNRGKGYAVKIGMLESQGRYCLFADSGCCVPLTYIQNGIQLLEQGADIVIASRGLENSQIIIKQPLYRQMGSRLFSCFIKNLMGINFVKDTQCGFKFFKNEVAHKIFSQLMIDGFMFDIEVLIKGKQYGYKIVEFPVQWSNDSDTRFKPVSGSWHNFRELVRVWQSLKKFPGS